MSIWKWISRMLNISNVQETMICWCLPCYCWNFEVDFTVIPIKFDVFACKGRWPKAMYEISIYLSIYEQLVGLLCAKHTCMAGFVTSTSQRRDLNISNDIWNLIQISLKVFIVAVRTHRKVNGNYVIHNILQNIHNNYPKVREGEICDVFCEYHVIKWRHFPLYWSFVRGIHRWVTGGFPSPRPVTRSFDVFFDLRLNKRLSEQSRRRWFETPSRSLWRHCNVKLCSSFYICNWCVVRITCFLLLTFQ